MENELVIEEKLCSLCKESITIDTVFCSNCGNPENGTEQQKAQFFAKRAMNKTKNIDADKKIKSAKNTLFVLCAIMVVYGFINYAATNSIFELAISFFLAFIYLALAFWSEKKPFVALLVGLLTYLTLIAISAIVEPISIIKGILWKIIIISYLGKGMYSAFESQKEEKSFKVN